MDSRLKKKFMGLYEMFPYGSVGDFYFEELDEVEIKRLIKNDYIFRNPVYDENNKKIGYTYQIGPNFFSVVSAWKNEEMTKSMVRMTNTIIFLTFFIIFLSLASFLESLDQFSLIESLIWSLNVVIIISIIWNIIDRYGF